VLAAPADLDEGALAAVLGRAWGIDVAAMTYRPVGWGSHHWGFTDGGGGRWFVTVDELETKRLTGSESLDDGFARLRASLRAAADLRDAGCAFVVAPAPAGADRGTPAGRGVSGEGDDGEPVVRLGARFAVAVYPFVAGQSFTWGDGRSPEHRLGVLGMVVAVHTAPGRAREHALADEFMVPFRDQVEAVCAGDDGTDCGPYARPLSGLFRAHAPAVRAALDRYDQLVAAARAQPSRAVLTHGETHPGNTMLTADGSWLLIDWDTVLVAPPERDLWNLDPGDGSILDAYAAATGVRPLPGMLDLYRLRWDIADIAYDVGRFRRPHEGSADDDKSWQLLCTLLRRVGDEVC
jgi:hypothetical protein